MSEVQTLGSKGVKEAWDKLRREYEREKNEAQRLKREHEREEKKQYPNW